MIPKVSVSYDSYMNNIRNGFADLQQQRQFVDMTLAADGHHVQVHQTIVALASPYLKDLILSIPSKHPVIFLNNISYDELSYLLEYIYTGEVEIPRDKINCFIKIAKALHIIGIESGDISAPHVSDKHDDLDQIMNNHQLQENVQPQFTITINGNNIVQSKTIQEANENATYNTDNTCAPKTISAEKGESLIDCLNADFEDCFMETQQKVPTNQQNSYNFEQLFENQVTQITSFDNNDTTAQIAQNNFNLTDYSSMTNSVDCGNSQAQIPRIVIDLQEPLAMNNLNLLPMTTISTDNAVVNSDMVTDNGSVDAAKDLTSLCDEDIKDSCPRQYTVSNRGSIQLIMNRFIYYVHNLTDDGIKRRWRCVDYRTKKCLAYIDTEGETVVKRLNPHLHSFHDEKILKLISKNLVFTSYSAAADGLKKKNTL